MSAPPPQSEGELMERARDIAGTRLSEIAKRHGVAIPKRSTHAKGWTGTLLETALGATAASLPEPDFQVIGVELKSVPVRADGRPRESTYICSVPMPGGAVPVWRGSNVRLKLARVLWIPVVCEPESSFTERRVGAPLLWSPSPQEEAALRADWEELMDIVCLGRVDAITARHGTHLQIRPKAANAAARRRSVGETGAPTQTLPRGFYLRASFTAAIFRQHYALNL